MPFLEVKCYLFKLKSKNRQNKKKRLTQKPVNLQCGAFWNAKKRFTTGINVFQRGTTGKNINQREKTQPANKTQPETKKQPKTQTTKFSRKINNNESILSRRTTKN